MILSRDRVIARSDEQGDRQNALVAARWCTWRAGAVVYTAIEGRGVSGAKILGRGIIDTSEFARGLGGGSIHFEDSSDITIDGVIVRDSDVYGISAFGCHKLAISRVKLVGFWRYN